MVALRARRNDPRRERGAAALEFALVVPILCFLLFGIISYGYMLSFRQALSQAAAEGARSAAVAPTSLRDSCTTPTPAVTDCRQKRAIDAVNQALGSYGVTCDGAKLKHGTDDAGTCTISAPTACTGSTSGSKCVTVNLDYTYRDDALLPAFPLLGVILPNTLGYTTQAEVS